MDENNNPRYLTDVVKFNSKATQAIAPESSGDIKEPSGTWINSGPLPVLTRNQHSGDENDSTYSK